jgi:Fe-S-cluster-containing dehydrogenase component
MGRPEAPGRLDDAFGVALSAEPLRALDGRGRADVRASGKLRHSDAGALFFLAGEPADTLFVVARGSVRLEDGTSNDEPRLGRSVRPGELFGHEALVPFAVRGARAVAAESTSVLELQVGVLKRVLVRAGFPELLLREETRARRVEWRSLLRRTAFGALPPAELDALARELVEEPRERGGALDHLGERNGAAWLVAGGLFEIRSASDATAASRAVYAARGDFIGLLAPRARNGPTTAVALGAALALRLPREALERVAARYPNVFSALERVHSAREAKQRRTLEVAGRAATRHAADEMERLGSARSLLAIDLDRCTRCGHCTWACAESHGSARLERRGQKLVVTLRNAESMASTALLLPTACQHCREPACLDPCPTGAIRRDATGAVDLDQDLCTGCGACAKACPWEAIRMAPRQASANGVALIQKSAEVAVKCDLCRGHDGPECVSACPTDAIFRLDPTHDVVEVRAAVGPKQELRRSARDARRRPLGRLLGLALVPPFVALDRALPEASGHGARLAFGVLAALLVVVLAAHALVKRVGSVRRRARRALSRSGTVSTVAPFVAFHVASGVAAAACVFLHSGPRVPGGLAGALALAFWGVAASGVFGAAVYRFLPERLSRIERHSSLPEDEPEEREALLDRLHAAVSGENPAKKELVRRILLPYTRDFSGTISLVASGRTLGAEEAALGGRVERALGGRKSQRLTGLEHLVRTAVEMRALRARRLLRALLRAWLPIHLAFGTLLFVLLAFHVLGALR